MASIDYEPTIRKLLCLATVLKEFVEVSFIRS